MPTPVHKYKNQKVWFDSLYKELLKEVSDIDAVEESIKLFEKRLQKMHKKDVLTGDLSVKTMEDARIIALYFVRRGYRPELYLGGTAMCYSTFKLAIPYLTQQELECNKKQMLLPL